MFGDIAINVKQLTDEQVARYKSWYCGLCYALRDRFGQAGRLTLHPHLPSQITRLAFPVVAGGARWMVEVTREGGRIRPMC